MSMPFDAICHSMSRLPKHHRAIRICERRKVERLRRHVGRRRRRTQWRVQWDIALGLQHRSLRMREEPIARHLRLMGLRRWIIVRCPILCTKVAEERIPRAVDVLLLLRRRRCRLCVPAKKRRRPRMRMRMLMRILVRMMMVMMLVSMSVHGVSGRRSRGRRGTSTRMEHVVLAPAHVRTEE